VIRFPRFLHLLALLPVLLILGGCPGRSEAPAAVHRSRILMGTVIEITAYGPEQKPLERAVGQAFAEMARIENLMTPHQPQSDVAHLSAADGPLQVSPETAAVIAAGLKVGAASDGAFDMGLGRLKDLWDIEGEHPRIPGAEELRAALVGTGAGDLRLAGRTVTKRDPRLLVDLGGIAKGYAVDRAIAVLQAAGVKHAAVNAGGDIRLLGGRGDRPWKIGIQHPRRKDAILATLELANTAVVTSGDYERFFERDGVRYHHLFDPKTGQPARLCRSVTIVAPEAMLADALATAVFVLGPVAGPELLQRFPGCEGLIVAADGSTVTTPGLAGKVTWR
jgi:FAD:protein FMN transferase